MRNVCVNGDAAAPSIRQEPDIMRQRSDPGPEFACPDVRELASDYIDGELPPQLAMTIAAHLRDCAECETYFAELRTTVRLLGALPPQPPPADVTQRLLAAFRAWHADR